MVGFRLAIEPGRVFKYLKQLYADVVDCELEFVEYVYSRLYNVLCVTEIKVQGALDSGGWRYGEISI